LEPMHDVMLPQLGIGFTDVVKRATARADELDPREFADDIRDGLAALEVPDPVRLDLFKAPHHGSRQNMSWSLVTAVDCPLWLFSSDGTQHRHPDAQAIAMILAFGVNSNPELAFNVRSKYSGWWDSEPWRDTFAWRVVLSVVWSLVVTVSVPARCPPMMNARVCGGVV